MTRPILDHPALRVALVVITTLVLQFTLAPRIQLHGVTADFMLLMALASVMVAGLERGVVTAFVFGLAFDFVLQTPFGLSALVYCLTAYLVGSVISGVGKSGWHVNAVTLATGTMVAVCMYALGGRIFGEPWLPPGRLAWVIVVEVLFNAALASVARRVARWCFAAAHLELRLRT
jgi:rod shape-determining protein MreD